MDDNAPSIEMGNLSISDRDSLLGCILRGLPEDPNGETNASHISDERAQEALDIIWNLLPSKPSSTWNSEVVVGDRTVSAAVLRRLATKVALRIKKLPTTFYLQHVKKTDAESRGAGSFADVYLGECDGRKVALKRIRVDEREKEKNTDFHHEFCRESLLWKGLRHHNVLPFLGVSDRPFDSTLCMVLPWMDNGNVRQYVYKLREEKKVPPEEYVQYVIRWLCEIAEGLSYLHEQGVVHADLHGGNILIDEKESVRLTDFGLGVLANAHAGSYGSKVGGGAFEHRAPELHDPSVFGIGSGITDRPTPASDTFAFGCVAVELWSTQRVFFGMRHITIGNSVLKGGRPPRPSTPEGIPMPASLWNLLHACWYQLPSRRLPMHEVLVHMRNIADGGEVDIPQRPIMDTIEEEEADPVTAAGQPQSTGKAVQTSPAISPAKPAPLRNPASTQGSKLSRISSPQTVSVDEKPDVDFDGLSCGCHCIIC